MRHSRLLYALFAVLAVGPLPHFAGDVRGAEQLRQPGASQEGRRPNGVDALREIAFRQTLRSSPSDRIELIEYRDVPLADALQFLTEETGWNFVPSVGATQTRVTLNLTDVPFETALEALCQSHGLWHRRDMKSRVIYLYTNDERLADTPDPFRLERLAEEINQAFPDSYVRLSPVGERIVVRGEAKDVMEAEQILRLVAESAPQAKAAAEPPSQVNVRRSSWLPDGSGLDFGIEGLTGRMADNLLARPPANIVNLLRIPGEQQVMLRVTVAEVDRNAARSIGLNALVASNDGGVKFGSLVGGIIGADAAEFLNGDANLPVSLDNGQIQLAINALRKQSLARTLAEPNLTALNGQTASFHAGGSFPVPVVSGLMAPGLQGVQYKDFGVRLQFTPFILERDRVRLNVEATVSDQNKSLAVGIGGDANRGGTEVPGMNMRNFQTTVELREGQTLAVAGLIQNQFLGQADRVPFFGDLPVIGRLAAFDKVTAREHELVILITPEFVRSLDRCELPPLPGSDVFEPGDIEFYLGAHLEGTRGLDYRSPVRNDLGRQKRFVHDRDVFIIGAGGYSCGSIGGYDPILR